MKRFFQLAFAVNILCLTQHTAYSQQVIFDKAETDTVIKVMGNSRNLYLVTSTKVQRIRRKGLQQLYICPDTIRDAAMKDDRLFLATTKGVISIEGTKGIPQPFHKDSVNYAVDNVAIDHLGRVWFSARLRGAFMEDQNLHLVQKVRTQAVYEMACTPDGFTWIGTNTGLYRINAAGDINRFAEEGMEGYELPDNLVEQIFTDGQSNVWAIMPDNLTFIPSSHFEGSLPVYDHVGSPHNEVRCIMRLPGRGNKYAFATTEGLMYTRNDNPATSPTSEIFQYHEQPAYLLKDEDIRRPATFRKEMIYGLYEVGKTIFFISHKGFWGVPYSRLNISDRETR